MRRTRLPAILGIAELAAAAAGGAVAHCEVRRIGGGGAVARCDVRKSGGAVAQCDVRRIGGGGGGRRRAVAYCNVSRIGGGGSSVDSTRTYQVPAFRAVPLIGTS